MSERECECECECVGLRQKRTRNIREDWKVSKEPTRPGDEVFAECIHMRNADAVGQTRAVDVPWIGEKSKGERLERNCEKRERERERERELR